MTVRNPHYVEMIHDLFLHRPLHGNFPLFEMREALAEQLSCGIALFRPRSSPSELAAPAADDGREMLSSREWVFDCRQCRL